MIARLLQRALDAWTDRAGKTGHHEPAPFVDGKGWLEGEGVVRYPSVRASALTSGEPLGIVWHYTATRVGSAQSLAKRIRSYRRGVDRAASWHVLIADDGTIYQSVEFLRGAWHCARGKIDGHRVNRCTIGIELEGFGKNFSLEQVEAAEAVVAAIVNAYDLERDRCAYDHSDFDPKRRSDAGPVWAKHREYILDRIFGNRSRVV